MTDTTGLATVHMVQGNKDTAWQQELFFAILLHRQGVNHVLL
jgi:hypothetical protein